MSSRNWQDLGIVWLEEQVYRKDGNTKVLVNGVAQIPQVVDLAKAAEHFGADAVLGGINGTSWRVMAQAVNRTMLPQKATPEAIREAIRNRILRIRNASGPRGPRQMSAPLPGGTSFTYTEATPEVLVEYQQAYTAALVDQGIDGTTARNIALSLKL